MTAATQGLPRTARLLSARDFRRVYTRGRRANGRWFTLVGFRSRLEGGARLGLSVSKDHGGAVCRNKIKRLLREAFRLERSALPANLELVLIPRKTDKKLELPLLRQELVALVQQLASAPNNRRPGPRS
jgi:ribonuclease P protein component